MHGRLLGTTLPQWFSLFSYSRTISERIMQREWYSWVNIFVAPFPLLSRPQSYGALRNKKILNSTLASFYCDFYCIWYKHNIVRERGHTFQKYKKDISLLQDKNYPGTPADSIRLASVTSSLQMSNCHLRRPSTPQSTDPVCTPMRMFTSTPVANLTCLKTQHTHYCATSIFHSVLSWEGDGSVYPFVLF